MEVNQRLTFFRILLIVHLLVGLSNKNVGNTSLDFEILSSTEKTNAATIYGVVRINNACNNKSEKIGNFFNKKSIIKRVIIEAFGYDPDYTKIYDFDTDIIQGSSNESYLSEEMQKYLPIFWEKIDFKELKNERDDITDDLIGRLTDQIAQLHNHGNDKQKAGKSDEIEMTNHLLANKQHSTTL